MSKTLTLYFINVEQVHLGKDVFLAPYYLGKELGANVRIVYPMTDTNQSLPKYHRGVRLIPISLFHKPITNKYLRHIFALLFILRYVVPSAYAMFFHYYRMFTPLYGIVYKTLNPFGKLYVKLDADIIALKYKDEYKNRFDAIVRNLIHWWFAKIVDCVSCETSVAFNAIMNSKATCYKFRNDMVKMHNGFDEEGLQSVGLNLIPCEKKENIFITVGRLGTEQKNTEMILDALARVDLRDWKFYLIGPIEKDFQSKIDSFYESNPDKRNNVIFTGSISSKREIWDYYNRAKVFVLSSTFEACALVLCEAYKFSDYIVSTDVGIFSDIVNKEQEGMVVNQNDAKQLAHIMEDIIQGNIHIDCSERETDKLNWDKLVKVVANKMSDEPNKILLLTACVTPGGMAYTALQDSTERERQYLNALRWYLANTEFPIVMCENTSYQLPVEFKPYIDSGRLEFLSFDGNNSFDKSRGKGYGEALIIMYAIDHSRLIAHADVIMKMTGRQILRNIVFVVKHSPNPNCVYANIRKRNLGIMQALSQFYICPKTFYTKYFLRNMDKLDDSRFYYFEHLLYDSMALWKQDKAGCISEFWMPLKIEGSSGTLNKPLEMKSMPWLRSIVLFFMHRFKWYRFRQGDNGDSLKVVLDKRRFMGGGKITMTIELPYVEYSKCA